MLNISRIKGNQTVNSLLKFLGKPRGKPDTNIDQHEQHKREFSMRYFSLLKKYELHFRNFKKFSCDVQYFIKGNA